jgi:hypothetical protein
MPDPRSLPQAENPGESAPKKSTSSAKVEANRRNAKWSTGPKTPRGKKHSSRNAITHGLVTKKAGITSGPGKEDEDEFASLHANFRKCLEPVGFEEEQVVEDLAHCRQSTRRAQRFENAAVTLASEVERANPELSEVEQQMLNLKPADEARYELQLSSRGINHLLQVIEYIRKEVLAGHAITAAPDWLLPKGVWKSSFGINDRADALKQEATVLTALKLLVERAEADKEATQRDLAAIPDKGDLDRLLRYGNSNQHQAYRLRERLDQLQDRRRRKDAETALKMGDTEGSKKT